MDKTLKRVIFTCGGTAGHVNPAIALAQRIAESNPDAEFLFVGAERGLEKDLVPKAGYAFHTVRISSFHRSFKLKEIRHNLISVLNLIRSPREAKAILEEFRPEIVIGTGGYASFPMVKAAAKMGIPTAVHESNIVPGLTTELLEPFADRIMVGLSPAVSTTNTRRRCWSPARRFGGISLPSPRRKPRKSWVWMTVVPLSFLFGGLWALPA